MGAFLLLTQFRPPMNDPDPSAGEIILLAIVIGIVTTVIAYAVSQ